MTPADLAASIEAPPDAERVATMIGEECDALKALLLAKNAAYGNSAIQPLRIFSRADSVEQIKVRLDDKLSRLARGTAAGEDVELDLLGYLILLRVARMLANPAAVAAVATPVPAPLCASPHPRWWSTTCTLCAGHADLHSGVNAAGQLVTWPGHPGMEDRK